MSASPLTSILFDHGGTHPPTQRAPQLYSVPSNKHLQTTMSGVFSGLKKKLSRSSNSMSRRNTNTSANEQPEASWGTSPTDTSGFLMLQNNNPFASGAPATRRPRGSGRSPFTMPSNDPPPAYTATPGRSASIQPTMTAPAAAAEVDDDNDQYAFLKTFDTIFLIDDSGSMAGYRWGQTAKALKTITPICTRHDEDGVDVYFLNHPDDEFFRNVKEDSTVVEIFQTVRPSGLTPTGTRLDSILRPYLTKYEANPGTTKPINIIVITDGVPTDCVESSIIQAAKKLDKLDAPAWQVGIQFFQVGNDSGAREHLKQMDDELREIAKDPHLRDIVDTVPFSGKDGAALTATGILKVVLGSVNRRLDRNSKELHR